MNKKVIIGIDPGKEGFITAMFPDGEFQFFSMTDNTDGQCADFIAGLASNPCVVAMEDVHAIFGSSAKTTFSFGQIKGFLLGLIVANKIPYHLIPPKTWQKLIWENCDKVMSAGKVDTKKTSTNAALRIFPTIDFRRNERCRILDNNKVDATLIAEYARRKNL